MSSSCDSYCEHGGICVLERGHTGLHDSKSCQWDDAHALTEEEADAVLAADPAGAIYLGVKAFIAPFVPEGESI